MLRRTFLSLLPAPLALSLLPASAIADVTNTKRWETWPEFLKRLYAIDAKYTTGLYDKQIQTWYTDKRTSDWVWDTLNNWERFTYDGIHFNLLGKPVVVDPSKVENEPMYDYEYRDWFYIQRELK